ncbi:glycosyltransferase family 2 protein [Shimwellia blattae]|uniref:Putative glycosyltransferase n=1 Tax=Shimwellia blattae (strain ATCC 29907 / DSM 4481 / JCM 1650 / NBRC 105725 / CDC 9005-74) TaxID=630626 RepID=I2B7Q5_SHIBC|nr:glycosyltransferase [Shimwellia blattae]AFJ46559.1 putative glycosyltransferase [Shimwellia blattae DSM 4481 = NBRC 105725]VDY64027.1 PGL/p-HBAD biosynthesis glycosyltransferase Rv2957/MT3031 [Shimwellia blattae]
MNNIQPAVSVVIPIYNAASYFPTVLSRILEQTLANIEIIIVDDHSSDTTLDMIGEYAKYDSRIIILSNDNNNGAGESRNKGLQIATGEYIIFLDDDDLIAVNMLEKLYATASACNADIAVCRSQFIDWNTRKVTDTPWTIRDDLLPSKSVFSGGEIESDFFRAFVWWPWDKLYRRERIISSGIFFQEIRTSNDLFFTVTQMLMANRITIVSDILIEHVVNRACSLENTRNISWRCAIDALEKVRLFLEEYSLYPRRRKDFVNYALSFLKWNIDTLSGDAYKLFYDCSRETIAAYKIDKNELYEQELVIFLDDLLQLNYFEYLIKLRDFLSKKCGLFEGELNDVNDALKVSNENIERLHDNLNSINELLSSKENDIEILRLSLDTEKNKNHILLSSLSTEEKKNDILKLSLDSEIRKNTILHDQIEEYKVHIRDIMTSKTWRYTKVFRRK